MQDSQPAAPSGTPAADAYNAETATQAAAYANSQSGAQQDTGPGADSAPQLPALSLSGPSGVTTPSPGTGTVGLNGLSYGGNLSYGGISLNDGVYFSGGNGAYPANSDNVQLANFSLPDINLPNLSSLVPDFVSVGVNTPGLSIGAVLGGLKLLAPGLGGLSIPTALSSVSLSGSAALELDKYGGVFISVGPSVGVSMDGWGETINANYFFAPTNQPNNRTTLENFLGGYSKAVAVGYWGGGVYTWHSSGSSFDAGEFSPQAGGS